MKSEASEQNGNEKHIYHRILSWCGEHKMLTRLLIIGIFALTFTGAYLRFSEEGCESINLTLNWPETGDTYSIKGDPAITTYEEEEIMLSVTVSTVKPGLLKVIAKPESDRPVWLTMNREDKNSWKKGEIQVYYHSIVNQLESTSSPVWIKAKKDQDGLALHCIIVEAFFLNGECSIIKYAYIDVEKGAIPTIPPVTPPPTSEPDPWYERIWNWCTGTVTLAVTTLLGVFFLHLRKENENL
jgi:hypothetical protein